MADTPGNVNINITGTDQSKPAFDSATSNVDKLDKSAARANTQLKSLGSQKVAPLVDVQLRDQALAKAKSDLASLRADVAKGMILGTDTRAATSDINALKRSIKSLEGDRITIPVNGENIARTNADLGRLRTQVFSVTSQLPGLAQLLGTGGLLAGSGLAATKVVQVAASMEQLKVQMDAIFKGGAGQGVIDTLNKLSATTPLNFEDLAKAARSLGAAGISASDVTKDIKSL